MQHCAGAQAARAIQCPTCRKRTLVSEIAYVDAGRAPAAERGEGLEGTLAPGAAHEEERIAVRGSYSTKVRCRRL